MITLYAFVGVDRTIVDANLFRHFCRYYRRLGVDAIVCDLQSNVGDEERIELFREIAARDGNAEIRHVVREPYSSAGNQRRYTDSFVQSHTEGWCILADVDEFVAFPQPIDDFFRQCERNGANVVEGELVDRLAPDFGFPSITGESLDAQFPWTYPMTRLIRGGNDRKIVAYKGRIVLSEGHHYAEETTYWSRWLPQKIARIARLLRVPLGHLPESARPAVWSWPERLPVYHFAWDATLESKMRARQTSDWEFPEEIEGVLAYIASPDRRAILNEQLLRRITRALTG